MIVLPGRNFSRYLLTLFILFCLVIRTAYQGKQFELLQKDIRPADVESIDEMIERNFTLNFPITKQMFFEQMDFMKRFEFQTGFVTQVNSIFLQDQI